MMLHRSHPGPSAKPQRGFTLMELIVASAILSILTLMALPLARITIQREKEKELRRALWEMRDAIDRYKDAADRQAFQIKLDSGGYPPTLEELVKGVEIQGDKKVRFLRSIPVDPMTKSKEWGLALDAGRSRLHILGRTERIRRLHQIRRHRTRRIEIQRLVRKTGKKDRREGSGSIQDYFNPMSS